VNLWVEGELSNLKRPPSGHLYFTLKDDRSQLPAVMFRSALRHVRFRPEDGSSVLVWGHITVYEPRGAYQIQVSRIEPRGKGALQLAFEQLKERLAKEGLFAPERKRPLPLLPRRVGIVTSPTGAAVRDLCRILHRRFPNLEVVIYPAQVQGEMAAADIAAGVRVLNRLGGFDVLIVTRGGGSLEDLWPFNEESVARAIAASRIPVVSAVGHEIDFTISDFVADVRAATPSAAAEIVIERKDAFAERLFTLSRRADQAVRAKARDARAQVDRLAANKAFAALHRSIFERSQRIDDTLYRARSATERALSASRRCLQDLERRLETRRVGRQLAEAQSQLGSLRSRLDAAQSRVVHRAQDRLGSLSAKLDAMSPLAVLSRGYSLTWSARGKLLRRADEVGVGERLRADLHSGWIVSRVEEIHRAVEEEETESARKNERTNDGI
jgi:exodeoxyribonuclease VII large subunit